MRTAKTHTIAVRQLLPPENTMTMKTKLNSKPQRMPPAPGRGRRGATPSAAAAAPAPPAPAPAFIGRMPDGARSATAALRITTCITCSCETSYCASARATRQFVGTRGARTHNRPTTRTDSNILSSMRLSGNSWPANTSLTFSTFGSPGYDCFRNESSSNKKKTNRAKRQALTSARKFFTSSTDECSGNSKSKSTVARDGFFNLILTVAVSLDVIVKLFFCKTHFAIHKNLF